MAFERYYYSYKYREEINMDATYKYIAIVSDSDDSINNLELKLNRFVGNPYADFIKKLPLIIRDENIDSIYDSYISPCSTLPDTSEEAFELALDALFSNRTTFYRREHFSVLFIRIKDETRFSINDADKFMISLKSCFKPSKEFIDLINEPRNSIVITKRDRDKKIVYQTIDEISASTLMDMNKNDH